jgi:hypothetical protein
VVAGLVLAALILFAAQPLRVPAGGGIGRGVAGLVLTLGLALPAVPGVAMALGIRAGARPPLDRGAPPR